LSCRPQFDDFRIDADGVSWLHRMPKLTFPDVENVQNFRYSYLRAARRLLGKQR
jgi:hypothetical protein